jgi:hypothetical protein
LNQPIQISPKTTAKSSTPDHETSSASVRNLADEHHVDEVVKQLEEADRAVLDHLAMRPGRPQEPTTQPRAQRHRWIDVLATALAHPACLLDGQRFSDRARSGCA